MKKITKKANEVIYPIALREMGGSVLYVKVNPNNAPDKKMIAWLKKVSWEKPTNIKEFSFKMHLWMQNRYKAEHKEKISLQENIEDAWLCICGNTPNSGGFVTCDENGDEMEPLIGSNWEKLNVCQECGRIVDQTTLDVVGRNANFKNLP